MALCEYHILEYTCSELQPNGKPFAVVLYLDEGKPNPLMGFVLKRWESVLPNPPAFEISSISEFLEDLGQYSQETAELSRTFFTQLNTLSVGPVRALVSGACTLEDLNAICPLFFGIDNCIGPWQERFDRVRPSLLS
jgi:hypothetical protein